MRGLFAILLLLSFAASSQMPAFRNVTTAKGLDDGAIRCFGQDKYGYIWIGTQSGLNRYDSYTVKQFLNVPGDTNSIYSGTIWGMKMGPDSNMYFGSPQGLLRYNYATNNFTRLKADRPFATGQMVVLNQNTLLHGSSKGLMLHNTATGSLGFFSDEVKDSAQGQLAQMGLGDVALLKDGRVLATCRNGLLSFDINKKQVKLITVPGLIQQHMSNVEVAADGTVWLCFYNQAKLVKTDIHFKSFQVYDYLFPRINVLPNSITGLLIDKQDRLWVTTLPDGLCLYRPQTNDFVSYKSDPFVPASLHANHLTTSFQDRSGTIWLGSEGYGVSYFQPDKRKFQTLFPRSMNTGNGWTWGRAASQDKDGDLWLATANGVIQYDENSGSTKHFYNKDKDDRQIYYNSVRGILSEDDLIWIITGGGVNRLHRTTGEIDFLDAADSLPPAFYFTGYKDSRGTLWIGGRDYDGLYYRDAKGLFQGIRHHPVLKNLLQYNGYGVRSIFEDSRRRMWFGLNSGGLALFDVTKQELKHWQWKENDSTSLTGDLVTGIAEDKDGVIWVSTTSGIAAYDEKKNRFTQYTKQLGLPSVRTSSIQVDAYNRVWAGSTHGLLMLDGHRKNWIVFDEDDGLTDAEFADMPSQQLQDGRFVFPTLKGFVLFNPLDHKEKKKQLQSYITGFRVFNEPALMNINHEALKSIHLEHKQNFFSLELTALNYDNPSKTCYAYKLDGFDKDWVYTKDRVVNYTNVPGGEYRFLYKVSNDPNDWNVPEKVLIISVSTVYYKVFWFWLAVAVLICAILYAIYRFRMKKQRQILQLETRARELEKEKTVVQYESLKQHLNPHFLFNSLTSLRSLIKTDTKTATGFLDGLSKVYRYVLRSGDKELSPLRDEIDFVRTFVSLQKTRFREGLDVRIDVDENCLERYVVPVTLQNLIENAIKHNTADEESPLQIHITTEDGYVAVRNNLQRYAIVETSNKHGLKSMKKLYQYYTPKPVLVKADEQFFTVKIPLL